MKKLNLLLCFLGLIIFAQAQVPQGINYQAVLRERNNLMIDENVEMKFTINQGGAITYQETHTLETNDYGLVNLVIGKGSALSGNFNTINWNLGNLTMKVEVKKLSSGSFVTLGEQDMVSVPFSLYAKEAETVQNDQVDDADSDPANEIQNLSISGNMLSLTNGGGTVALPTGTTYSAGTGIDLAANTITNTGDLDPADDLLIGSAAGGDLSGTYPNPSVVQLQGNPVSNQAPNTGQVLRWDGTQWVPGPDDVNDADADPANEIQSLSLSGNSLTLSNGGGNVNLPTGTTYSAGNGIDINGNVISNTGDLDPANEIQSLNLSGNSLSLSNGGGSVNLPTGTTYSAGTGISISGSTISNTGDLDAANELQSLNLAGTTLSLSNGGGNVSLAGFLSYWAGTTDIYRFGGKVGIGTATPNSRLHVNSSSTENGLRVQINGSTKFLVSNNGGITLGSASSPPVNGVFINGNLGVGTNVPLAKVDVRGTLKVRTVIDGETSSGANQYLLSSSSGGGFIQTYGPNGLGNITLSSLSGNANRGYISIKDESQVNRVTMNVSSNKAGRIDIYGPNGQRNAFLSNLNNSDNNGYVGVVDAGGTIEAGMYVTTSGTGTIFADGANGGVKNFLMPHPTRPGKKIAYASLEGPEAGAYTRGTAQLVNGEAEIRFSEHFEIVANPTTMTIMTSPLSASSKGLAIVEKTATGFKVKELGGGLGNYEFDWEVKAVRKGWETYKVIRDVKDLPTPQAPATENMPAKSSNE